MGGPRIELGYPAYEADIFNHWTIHAFYRIDWILICIFSLNHFYCINIIFMNTLINNPIVSSSIVWIPLIYSIYTKNPFLLFLCMIIYIILIVIKYMLDFLYTRNRQWIERPDPNAPCGLFGSPSDNLGMPSIHAALSLFISIFILQLLSYNKKTLSNQILKIVFIAYPLFIGYSRMYLNCHSLSQIIMGYIIGFIIGYLFFWYINKFIIPFI